MNNWGRKKEENNLPRKQWAVFTPLKNAGKIPPDFGWKVNRWLQSLSILAFSHTNKYASQTQMNESKGL